MNLMKSLLAILTSVIALATCPGQSTIHFANTATTLLTTNNFVDPVGPMNPAGAYRVGLYAAPFPADPNSLAPVGTTLNSTVPGRFDGGFVITGFPVPSQITFQVRAWSAFAGATYEEALNFATSNSGVLAGQSAFGFFTLPASGSIEIFGTGPGQIGGFALTPVPEPGPVFIALVGSALCFLCRRIR